MYLSYLAYRKGCEDSKFLKETYTEMRAKHKSKIEEEERKKNAALIQDLNVDAQRKAVEFRCILEAINAERKACTELNCMHESLAEVNMKEQAAQPEDNKAAVTTKKKGVKL